LPVFLKEAVVIYFFKLLFTPENGRCEINTAKLNALQVFVVCRKCSLKRQKDTPIQALATTASLSDVKEKLKLPFAKDLVSLYFSFLLLDKRERQFLAFPTYFLTTSICMFKRTSFVMMPF